MEARHILWKVAPGYGSSHIYGGWRLAYGRYYGRSLPGYGVKNSLWKLYGSDFDLWKHLWKKKRVPM